jgi:hypothetical protein
MTQTGTSAWWADVQHLRDAAERTDEGRRRADQADLAARRASRERRHVEAEAAPMPAPAPSRSESDVPQSRGRPESDVPQSRRRFEADPPTQPRRRAHADPAAAPRRHEGPPVARRGGYGEVAIPGRRTIEIRGRTVPAPAVPRSAELDRTRRPPRRAVERVGPRPDRMAMWALLMGLVLIAVAITTASPT